jgi:hypothetical protein
MIGNGIGVTTGVPKWIDVSSKLAFHGKVIVNLKLMASPLVAPSGIGGICPYPLLVNQPGGVPQGLTTLVQVRIQRSRC